MDASSIVFHAVSAVVLMGLVWAVIDRNRTLMLLRAAVGGKDFFLAGLPHLFIKRFCRAIGAEYSVVSEPSAQSNFAPKASKASIVRLRPRGLFDLHADFQVVKVVMRRNCKNGLIADIYTLEESKTFKISSEVLSNHLGLQVRLKSVASISTVNCEVS